MYVRAYVCTTTVFGEEKKELFAPSFKISLVALNKFSVTLLRFSKAGEKLDSYIKRDVSV